VGDGPDDVWPGQIEGKPRDRRVGHVRKYLKKINNVLRQTTEGSMQAINNGEATQSREQTVFRARSPNRCVFGLQKQYLVLKRWQ
jgi:hypothetical protein